MRAAADSGSAAGVGAAVRLEPRLGGSAASVRAAAGERRKRREQPEAQGEEEGSARVEEERGWGTLLGLEDKLCHGCEEALCGSCKEHSAGHACLWLRPPSDMARYGLTVDALRLLAHAAEYHYRPDLHRPRVQLPPIRTVDVYYNSQIGGGEGEGEGMRLFLRMLACIAPDVRSLYLVYCGLGGAETGELAEALERFASLEQLWLTFNPEATMHTHRLRKRWKTLKHPSRRLGWGTDWNPRTGSPPNLWVFFVASSIFVCFPRFFC